jgi:hypothetical protein
MGPTRVVLTRVVQSYSKEVQFLPTCCEQRVTYLVIGISDLELESTFLEQLRRRGTVGRRPDRTARRGTHCAAGAHGRQELRGGAVWGSASLGAADWSKPVCIDLTPRIL